MSAIQLFRRSSEVSDVSSSRLETYLIKLWFRSSFFSCLFSFSPSISEISLNERISVWRLTRFSKFSIFLILLFSKFKYTILVRSLYRDRLTIVCSAMQSS
jgi:hypothetical protein